MHVSLIKKKCLQIWTWDYKDCKFCFSRERTTVQLRIPLASLWVEITLPLDVSDFPHHCEKILDGSNFRGGFILAHSLGRDGPT